MQNSQGFSQGVFLSQGISHIFHSIFTGFHPIEHATVRLEEQNPEELEQESEYDTESESEMPATVDSDQEDEMTFLRAVTTRSGRTVRVASKLF